jgi:hypothetical protein
MPGDPRECRQHAWRCAELAITARTPELKLLLIELSQNWLKMATDLEHMQVLFAELSEEDRKRES